MEKELLKIVFQDGTPEDKQLSITVYGGKNEEGINMTLKLSISRSGLSCMIK